MAFLETFTGTNGTILQSRASDSGHSYSKASGSGDFVLDGSGRAAGMSSGLVVNILGYTPATVNFDIDVVFYFKSASTGEAVVKFNSQNNGVNCYEFGVAGATWVIRKLVSSVATNLATPAAFTPTLNTNYAVKLRYRNGIMRMYVNDVLVHDVADATYPTPSTFALRNVGSSARPHMDAVAIDDANPANDPVVSFPFNLGPQTDKRVFQRDARPSGKAVVPVAGSFNATPTKIQTRLLTGATVSVDWTDVTALSLDAGAHTWAGTVNVPQGGPYTMQARALDGSNAVLDTDASQTAAFSIGDVVAFVGSSTFARYITDFTGVPDARVSVYQFVGGWSSIAATGAGASAIGAKLADLLGVPVGLVFLAVGSTTLANWSGGSSDYTNAIARLNSVKFGSIGISALCIQVGRNDAADGILVSEADQLAKYTTLINNFRTGTSLPSLPIFIGGSQAGKGDPPGGHGGLYDMQRRAELRAAMLPNCYFASNNYDLARDAEGIHMTEPAYIEHASKRVGPAVAAVILGTAENKGPQIIGAWAEDATHTLVSLKLRQGTDFTPTTAIANFQVCFDGAAWLDAVGARVSPTQIRLTHADRGDKGGKLAHASLEAPAIAGTVKDNSANTLPADPVYVDITTATPVVFTVTDAVGATASMTRSIGISA